MADCCSSCNQWIQTTISDIENQWNEFADSETGQTVVKVLEVAKIILISSVCLFWSGPVWTIGGLVFGCFMPETTQRVIQDITNVVSNWGIPMKIIAFLFAVIVLPVSTGFASFLWAAHLISKEILESRPAKESQVPPETSLEAQVLETLQTIILTE